MANNNQQRAQEFTFQKDTRSTMMMQATPAIPSVGQKHLWIFETKDLWYRDLLSSDIDLEPFYVDFAFRIMSSNVLI